MTDHCGFTYLLLTRFSSNPSCPTTQDPKNNKNNNDNDSKKQWGHAQCTEKKKGTAHFVFIAGELSDH